MRAAPCVRWAEQEFGQAELGDERRTRRLVGVAAQAASTPAGRVTEVFSRSADREGAFRLLENDDVAVKDIAWSAHCAAARRSWGVAYAFVPIDQSSLSLIDEDNRKGVGIIGQRGKGAPGLCVMSAIAVLPDGTPSGICGQEFWARTEAAPKRKRSVKVEDKETQRWLDVMAQARRAFAAEAPETRPWFQADRGADAWPILIDAIDSGTLLTVRAAHDRRLMGTFDGEREYLWPQMEARRPAGRFDLVVPTGPNRQRRVANIQLRFCQVVLDLHDARTSRHRMTPMWAVHACEMGTTPDGEEPIEWMLLTTFAVRDLADAQVVLAGYATRWRIEEFHKTWKSGACRIEETQLQARDHIER